MPTLPKRTGKRDRNSALPTQPDPLERNEKGQKRSPEAKHHPGIACLKPDCYYCGITDQTIHALIANGSPGKRKDRGPTCQACQARFSRRRNTPLYQLKTPSQVVKKVTLLETHGVETSVLEDVYQVRESTITTIIKHTSMALLSPIISRAANKWLIIEAAIIFFGKD